MGYVREVVKRALELSATAIVLGTITLPAIVAAAKPLGVLVHDQIIVGKQGHASSAASA